MLSIKEKEIVYRYFLRAAKNLHLLPYINKKYNIKNSAEAILLHGSYYLLDTSKKMPTSLEINKEKLNLAIAQLIKPYILDFFNNKNFDITKFIYYVNLYSYETNFSIRDIDDYICYIYTVRRTITNFISSAFSWNRTPEKFDFFEEMHYQFIEYIESKIANVGWN